MSGEAVRGTTRPPGGRLRPLAAREWPDAAGKAAERGSQPPAAVLQTQVRPLFEAAAANFSPHSPAKVATGNQNRGPLLLITGGKDNTVPESVTRATLRQYRHSEAVTDILEFKDRSHSLTIDSGWREVADACLAWLQRQSL